MQVIELKINGRSVLAEEGETILEVARKNCVEIPALCYLEDLSPWGACRLCMVELKGDIVAACSTQACNGMEVETDSLRVRELRRRIIEMLVSYHKCDVCKRIGKCELEHLARKHGIAVGEWVKEERKDSSSPSIEMDLANGILCGKCVRVCEERQTVGALCVGGRGSWSKVSTAFEMPVSETACVDCGQCSLECPTGAISEKSCEKEVEDALGSGKHMIVQAAPSIRVAIAEEFGFPPGTLSTKKMAAALRRMGFAKVFDTDFGADFTTVEEAHEFLEKLAQRKTPLFTSCCPAWVSFIEKFYPHLIERVSSTKSPMEIFGTLAKTYYAKKMKLDPKQIIVVMIAPCTAKKHEAERKEMKIDGMKAVDFVLTTRELGRMLKRRGIDWNLLPEEEFDSPLGESSGAAAVYGASGGVAEALLRTVSYIAGGDCGMEFQPLRGVNGIKEATVQLMGREARVVVAQTLGNARIILDEFLEGKRSIDLLEVMACPGGCLGGGGQPIPTNKEIRLKRAQALYEQDRLLPVRKAHENPALKRVYWEFLGEQFGKKSKELLHVERKR
ncbi:(2Fe-2S)-binding protein [Candidatus Micrarchaeota archaeon]|nr:(2Fe-2S)-binding protein [Candidatus Micrarchaeota archaeon]